MESRFRRKLGGVLLFHLLAGASLRADVFSAPISDELIQGRLVLPNGVEALFQVREGRMVTVRDERAGYTYSLLPQILDPADNLTRFRPLRITREEGRDVAFQLWEARQEIAPGATAELDLDGFRFQLRFDGVGRAKFPVPVVDPRSKTSGELQELYGHGGGGACCVICGGVTVCADQVTLECGQCQGGHLVY